MTQENFHLPCFLYLSPTDAQPTKGASSWSLLHDSGIQIHTALASHHTLATVRGLVCICFFLKIVMYTIFLLLPLTVFVWLSHTNKFLMAKRFQFVGELLWKWAGPCACVQMQVFCEGPTECSEVSTRHLTEMLSKTQTVSCLRMGMSQILAVFCWIQWRNW